MQRSQKVILVCIQVVACVLLPLVAFADQPEQRSALRQLFIMWFPLLLFIGLWMFFIRYSGYGKLRKRSMEHMDALEQKVDRVIELLEEQRSRGS